MKTWLLIFLVLSHDGKETIESEARWFNTELGCYLVLKQLEKTMKVGL